MVLCSKMMTCRIILRGGMESNAKTGSVAHCKPPPSEAQLKPTLYTTSRCITPIQLVCSNLMDVSCERFSLCSSPAHYNCTIVQGAFSDLSGHSFRDSPPFQAEGPCSYASSGVLSSRCRSCSIKRLRSRSCTTASNARLFGALPSDDNVAQSWQPRQRASVIDA